MLNYKSIPDARPFCCGVILAIRGTCHPTPRNPGYPTCPLSQSVLMLTFLYSCCDCGQCKSLQLSALIMAIVTALAEAFGGLYFIEQWTNSRLLIKCNLVEAHFHLTMEIIYTYIVMPYIIDIESLYSLSSFILYFQIWRNVGTRLLVCCCEKSRDDKEKPLPLFSWCWRHFGLMVSVLAPINRRSTLVNK